MFSANRDLSQVNSQNLAITRRPAEVLLVSSVLLLFYPFLLGLSRLDSGPICKLRRVQEHRGFVIKQVEGIGEAYHFLDLLNLGTTLISAAGRVNGGE
jgi:hypothetical protein